MPRAAGKKKAAVKLRLTPEQNLVLIGFRASGKTAVGRALAQALKRPLVDLDQVLVAEAGRSIAELVQASGWPEFRRREKALVARYARQQGLVLAPGGGVVLDPDNVRELRAHGIIIWLTADPKVLRARLAQDLPGEASRPSLTGTDTLKEVEEVLNARNPLYQEAAQVTVDTTDLKIAQVVQQILAALGAPQAGAHGG